MNNQAKIVARTKQGEVLKGYVDREELSHFKENKPIYIHLVSSNNSVGTYVSQEQLEGLFLVKTFGGNKPNMLLRMFFDIRRIIKDNLSLISAAMVVATLSLAAFALML